MGDVDASVLRGCAFVSAVVIAHRTHFQCLLQNDALCQVLRLWNEGEEEE